MSERYRRFTSKLGFSSNKDIRHPVATAPPDEDALGVSITRDVFDVCGFMGMVLKGRHVAITEDEIPAVAHRSFGLLREEEGQPIAENAADCGTGITKGGEEGEDPMDVARRIDEHAERLRIEGKGSKAEGGLPLLVRFALSQRAGFLLAGALCGVVHGLVNSVGRFLLLRASINAVVNDAPMRTRIGLGLGTVLCICCEGVLLILTKHFFSDHVAHFMGGRQSTLILRKIARIGNRPRGTEEAQFVAADLPMLIEGVRVVAFLPSGAAGITGGIVMLIVFLGWGGAVGIVVLALMFWANIKLAAVSKHADTRMQGRLKDRLRIMKQVVDGIKAIKFYAWEENYTTLISKARSREVKAGTYYKALQMIGILIGRAAPVFGVAAVFVTRTLEGKTLPASEAFAALAVFQTLRIGMIFLPLSLTLLQVIFNNMGRTEAYLREPEPEPVDDYDLLGLSGKEEIGSTGPRFEAPAIHLKNCRAHWEKSEAPPKPKAAARAPRTEEGAAHTDGEDPATAPFMLNVPLLEVERGSLVAVVGQVGSGKSMLLETVLGGGPHLLKTEEDEDEDDHEDEGGPPSRKCCVRRVDLSFGVGYVPQQSLVVSGTVRENVTMGRVYSRARFDEAVQRACMGPDLMLLPHGEQTVVGERGTTLSGGQQQRLNVARALYGRPRLMVLDDPLAAVDTVVGSHIFDAIAKYVHSGRATGDDEDKGENEGSGGGGGGKGHVARPAALVVLNQLHLLPRCDKLVFMERGEVRAVGTYGEVLLRCGAFRDYVASYQSRAQGTADGPVGLLEHADTHKEPLRAPSSGEEPPPPSDSLAREPPGASTSNNASKGGAIPAASPSDGAPSSSPAEGAGVACAGQLIEKEAKATGAIRSGVLRKYLRSMGWTRFWFCLGLLAASYCALALNDIWLSSWTSRVDRGAVTSGAQSRYYCAVYCFLSAVFILTNLSFALLLVHLCGVSNARIHGECLSTVLAAPLSWFESVPSGRLLSRFGGDMAVMDVTFGWMADGFLQMSTSALMVLAVISYTNVALLALCVACVGGTCLSVTTVFTSLRECKRLSNNALSPVVTNCSEAVRGRLLGRVTGGCGGFFVRRHVRAVDRYLSASYVASTLIQLQSLCTQALALTVSVTATLVVLLADPGADESAEAEEERKALAGLALAYAFLLPYFLALSGDMAMLTLSTLPALERLFEYLPGAEKPLPAEAPREVPLVDQPLRAARWPQRGALRFENVSMRYRPDLPLFLKGFSLAIKGGEKVGIVGRTGAGKSTLLSVLFRLVEVESGAVTLDGANLARVGLQLLRGAVAMIPQEAVLVEGSVRENLDPFQRATDAELLAALDQVDLCSLGRRRIEGSEGLEGSEGFGGVGDACRRRSILDHQVGSGGESLSHGERQLLAVARVLLRSRGTVKVYVLDEPTAHVDAATDERLQRAVRTAFGGATVLTIAHRLHTVADADTIAVLDQGELLEHGPPLALLDRRGGATTGAFAAMVAALGPDAAATIRAKATAAAATAAASASPSPLPPRRNDGVGTGTDCTGLLLYHGSPTSK